MAKKASGINFRVYFIPLVTMFVMLLLTFASAIINNRSLDPRSRATDGVYPTATPYLNPSPTPTKIPVPTPTTVTLIPADTITGVNSATGLNCFDWCKKEGLDRYGDIYPYISYGCYEIGIYYNGVWMPDVYMTTNNVLGVDLSCKPPQPGECGNTMEKRGGMACGSGVVKEADWTYCRCKVLSASWDFRILGGYCYLPDGTRSKCSKDGYCTLPDGSLYSCKI